MMIILLRIWLIQVNNSNTNPKNKSLFFLTFVLDKRGLGMKLNQRGGSLVTVLLVILVFTVIGFALMESVIGENKRTNITEANMQTRYLAESGLTYFEADFKHFIAESSRANEFIDFRNFPIYLNTNFLNKYFAEDGVSVGESVNQSGTEGIKVKAEWVDKEGVKVTNFNSTDINNIRLKVISTGKIDSNEETLMGYYKPGIEIDKYTTEFEDFTADGMAIDFSNVDVAKLQLGLGKDIIEIANLDVIKVPGSAERYYRAPNDKLLYLGLLGPLINLNIPNAEAYKTMETYKVIATRQGQFLGADILSNNQLGTLISLDVGKLHVQNNTNVLIDGQYTGLQLLGIPLAVNYNDIDFRKLAVMGNVIIRQDREGVAQDAYYWGSFLGLPILKQSYEVRRRFSFDEGLYVYKSLVIGGKPSSNGNNLMLRGDMVTKENLFTSDVNIQFGDSDTNQSSFTPEEYTSDFYVHGDATIKASTCIKYKNGNYNFRVFSKGKITIENNKACNEYNGMFYAEKGIEIKTNGEKMKIRGRLIGDVNVVDDQIGNLEYPNYGSSDIYKVIVGNTKLILKGRSFE